MRTTALFQYFALAFALLVLSGCAVLQQQKRDDATWAATPPEPAQSAPPADGSIYHDEQGMELFSDSRAHRTGDVLTIVLVENTQAVKKASTSTSKTDKTSFGAPTILGRTINGATVATDGDRSFDGTGSSSQSNQLTGNITVTVVKRLANGTLMVRGEKWLTINQGQELIRIAGIVRPQDIGQDNSVPSTRVADAQISYTGRGTLADANTQGWLSRFFNSKWMPF
ncbi:flagellar basal body L-ring protein FlgH [Rhodanobacter sp. 7MK24]|uniref:flagellar basal body L-ring protein FlgH n=1 Tax=Rhodanobacter sp. 7MK24 TaxID=2775922 RepID=UPI0017801D1B|nr:flagellar basal body L-ring protein FlgH [Rhodanobacter sp. 7MK24]